MLSPLHFWTPQILDFLLHWKLSLSPFCCLLFSSPTPNSRLYGFSQVPSLFSIFTYFPSDFTPDFTPNVNTENSWIHIWGPEYWSSRFTYPIAYMTYTLRYLTSISNEHIKIQFLVFLSQKTPQPSPVNSTTTHLFTTCHLWLFPLPQTIYLTHQDIFSTSKVSL